MQTLKIHYRYWTHLCQQHTCLFMASVNGAKTSARVFRVSATNRPSRLSEFQTPIFRPHMLTLHGSNDCFKKRFPKAPGSYADQLPFSGSRIKRFIHSKRTTHTIIHKKSKHPHFDLKTCNPVWLIKAKVMQAEKKENIWLFFVT